jgi:hypothetical protein
VAREFKLKKRSCVIAIAAIVGVARLAFAAESGAPTDQDQFNYFDRILDNYPDIMLATVISSKTVTTMSGRRCFYAYSARITDRLRGNYKGTVFDFYADDSLATGENYLIYLSVDMAKKYRVSDNVTSELYDAHVEYQECKKLMTGFYLDYTELNEIKEFWDGSKLVRSVRISDARAKFPRAEIYNEVVSQIYFDYVKAHLGAH